ncbi:hypothetical protein Ciccas_006796 [Cichlidogyrus casuarinus]|uniref:Uncharacterized protein n=1 Tax=Cichlidogyrus casuarinus TaxID=1844966 RepID=A0ABD2Q5B3_9PLAT
MIKTACWPLASTSSLAHIARRLLVAPLANLEFPSWQSEQLQQSRTTASLPDSTPIPPRMGDLNLSQLFDKHDSTGSSVTQSTNAFMFKKNSAANSRKSKADQEEDTLRYYSKILSLNELMCAEKNRGLISRVVHRFKQQNRRDSYGKSSFVFMDTFGPDHKVSAAKSH